ncbi:MAG: YigZ family protein [Planctomycetaceae bacterium]|nr:YigZ family protein [Planctomycetaceae bacterium]
MTDADEEYLVPAGPGEATLVEKRSKFTARIFPVDSESEAQDHLFRLRKEYWDATHNVYAYVIRRGPVRYSDDGEPRGTSGQPTLHVLQAQAVENVLCVVTRYFGGVLLGAGGLVRAYSGAAKLALDAAGLARMRRWHQVLIPCEYGLYEVVRRRVTEVGGVVENADFGKDVLLEALVPVAVTDRLRLDLADISSGTVDAEIVDTVFRGAKIEPTNGPGHV